jgi:hypothetical protein
MTPCTINTKEVKYANIIAVMIILLDHALKSPRAKLDCSGAEIGKSFSSR